MSHAKEIFEAAGLKSAGSVTWGEDPRFHSPGVYIVEMPEALPQAPISIEEVARWLNRVPTLQLDGVRPKPKELAARLAKFWLPSQKVIYIGKATKSVKTRVGNYYDTPLGDSSPHSGGNWAHTLRGLENATVHYCDTRTPDDVEARMLESFHLRVTKEEAAQLHDPTLVLPFANRRLPSGTLKAHGISGSTR